MADIKNLFGVVMSEIQSTSSAWHESDYKSIKQLEVDLRGRFGEVLIERILTELGFHVESNDTTDRKNKHWDIRDHTNGLDIEVKTATLGNKQKTFQHEAFEKDRNYHAAILLDIAPSTLYITVAKKSDMPFDEKNDLFTVRRKKLHKRPNGHYKWTLNEKDCKGREVETLDDFWAMYEPLLKDG